MSCVSLHVSPMPSQSLLPADKGMMHVRVDGAHVASAEPSCGSALCLLSLLSMLQREFGQAACHFVYLRLKET